MVTITKFDIMSVGKIMGVWYAIFGLIVGIIFALVYLIGSLISGGSLEIALAVGMSIFGLIGFPIGYGLMGFISGLLMALIYNLCSKWVGGIKVDVE